MSKGIGFQMGGREWTMLTLLSILWGGSFFFNGVAVTELPALTIVTLRVGLAAVALWAVVFTMGLKLSGGIRIWLAFAGMGLLNNAIPFWLIVWGQTQVASGIASILNATTPLFTVVIAGLLLPDERATPAKLLGVAIGFVGVVVMIGLPAMGDGGQLLPQLAIILAAISYACAGIFGRRFKRLNISPVLAAAGQVTASTLILIPVAFIVDGPVNFLSISSHVWLAIIALAMLSTAIGYLLYFKLLSSAGATNSLLVTMLVPVSAILLGALFLNEVLGYVHFFGMLLIALGFSVIDGRLWMRFTRKFLFQKLHDN